MGLSVKSPIWKSIRRHRLAEEPQCRECAIEGTIPANQVDHIEPHRGEWSLFMNTDTKAYVFTTTKRIGIKRDPDLNHRGAQKILKA